MHRNVHYLGTYKKNGIFYRVREYTFVGFKAQVDKEMYEMRSKVQEKAKDYKTRPNFGRTSNRIRNIQLKCVSELFGDTTLPIVNIVSHKPNLGILSVDAFIGYKNV